MPVVYEAVNRMQETPWRVNRKVLRVMQQIEDLGGGRAGLPKRDPLEIPVKPFDFDSVSREELKADPRFREWKRLAKETQVDEAIRITKARDLVRLLEVAEDVADEPAIWFPWSLDFRGRAYPISDYLNPQGDDRHKGLLEFAEGKPLGPEGAWYLALHGANCLDEVPEVFQTGEEGEVVKMGHRAVHDRVKWIEEHTLEILRVAKDPLGVTWWQDLENPWTFLAFCLEWLGFYQYHRRGEGEKYVSHLPVASDGTCNGLQHFAALWLDEVGGSYVNVTPNETPEDVYARVAEIVLKRVEEEAGQGDPVAQRWLDSGLIGRGLTKREVMTYSYGSRKYGFGKQLMQYLEEKMGRRQAKDFFLVRGEGEEGQVCNVKKACRYMAAVIEDSLASSVRAAAAGMDWFQGCARVITKEGSPVSWVVPATGFRVVQPYYKLSKKQIKTHLLGKVITPVVYSEDPEPDPRKQANAVSPNIIHSLDAAALMLTVVNCAREQEGMAFGMVHDSYSTHAGDAGLLNRVLRESFVQLYTQHDVLDHLRQQFEEQVADPSELPEAPEKGNLAVSDVLFSDHFFC